MKLRQGYAGLVASPVYGGAGVIGLRSKNVDFVYIVGLNIRRQ